MLVGDYINIMKTTFDFNFDIYQAFKQQQNKKVVLIILIYSPPTVVLSIKCIVLNITRSCSSKIKPSPST